MESKKNEAITTSFLFYKFNQDSGFSVVVFCNTKNLITALPEESV
jgi:hypothetical protein